MASTISMEARSRSRKRGGEVGVSERWGDEVMLSPALGTRRRGDHMEWILTLSEPVTYNTEPFLCQFLSALGMALQASITRLAKSWRQ